MKIIYIYLHTIVGNSGTQFDVEFLFYAKKRIIKKYTYIYTYEAP